MERPAPVREALGHPRGTAGGATTKSRPYAARRQEPDPSQLDVHRDTISVATLLPDRTAAAVEQIPSDEAAVLAFMGRFLESARLRVAMRRPDRL